jgi:hypothetical protein
MKPEVPLKSGDEYDALTPWKRFYHFKPGTRKEIKRGFRKRVRRFVRKMLRKQDDDDQ